MGIGKQGSGPGSEYIARARGVRDAPDIFIRVAAFYDELLLADKLAGGVAIEFESFITHEICSHLIRCVFDQM